jgi:hypothetical protein
MARTVRLHSFLGLGKPFGTPTTLRVASDREHLVANARALASRDYYNLAAAYGDSNARTWPTHLNSFQCSWVELHKGEFKCGP